MSKLSFITVLLSLISISLFAGNGKISGTVTDASNGETLVGVAVLIQGTTVGAATDLDGNYVIENVLAGTYKLEISYIGYQKKLIDEVVVKSGETTNVNIILEPSAHTLTEVVIAASMKKENVASVLTLQKNSATVSDGISAESIRRSPDKTTSEVIRRVSGVSIQDNKFAVIRGLSDRYNFALVNGSVLPSTEADRKAFSFDLFPANLIDNIIINKAATPDMPAEFAGGVIQVNTKDIPEDNFISLQAGTGFNSQTMGKSFQGSAKGNTDWIGIDDGSRAIPAAFGTDPLAYRSLSRDKQVEISKSMPNDWGLYDRGEAPLNQSYQLSGGLSKTMKNDQTFGVIFALTYNNTSRFQSINRKLYDLSRQLIFDFDDAQYKNNVLGGALLNLSYKINDHHKITLKNNFNINSEDITTLRTGLNYDAGQRVRNSVMRFNSNQLYTSQLTGDHYLGRGIKLKWKAGYGMTQRDIPNLRQTYYYLNTDDTEDTTYTAYVPYNASPNYSGKFYSHLSENNYVFNTDLSIPFSVMGVQQSVKVGGWYSRRDRDFRARVLGLVILNPSNYHLLDLPQDQIFDVQNISQNGFGYEDITNSSDAYTANSTNIAGYVMWDGKIGDRLRTVLGARGEHFAQHLDSYFGNAPLVVDTKQFNVLPSLNLSFALTPNANLRFCASQTVSRPEFRELSPFSFYNFEENASEVGQSKLKQTDIYNLDLRYEVFPDKGQLLSVSAFYKYFKNPIERIFFQTGVATQTRTYTNAENAYVYGAELEVRKNFDFLSRWTSMGIWSDFTIFSNLAYMISDVTFQNEHRPLQGQSPYVINAGLQYVNADNGWGASLMFNEIGRRIREVGDNTFPDIYEAPRPILDFQISKRIFRNGEIRINCGDLLNKGQVFYQDLNKNGKYDSSDNALNTLKLGSNYSVSLSYRF